MPKEYIVIKEFVVKSFPNDYIVKKGETVISMGLIRGDMVIQLDNTIHKSGYSHLSHAHALLDNKQLQCLKEIKEL